MAATTTTITTTTTTTTTPFLIDFNVADHIVLDEFIVIEPYLTDKTRTKTKSCDENSNVAIKFGQFDTTASLTLTAQSGDSIFSKTFFMMV